MDLPPAVPPFAGTGDPTPGPQTEAPKVTTSAVRCSSGAVDGRRSSGQTVKRAQAPLEAYSVHRVPRTGHGPEGYFSKGC